VDEDLAQRLRASLARQEELIRSTLVLNPVENFPFPEDLRVAAGPLHGLYNTDKSRTRQQRLETVMQFANREAMERDAREIYNAWAEALGAADVTLRLLSGLHAHTVLFMAMAERGQKVLLLPVEAGGHVSGRAILERLGLEIIEMVVDEEGMCINGEATIERCLRHRPDFVFVDRSEGLVFEDFSSLAEVDGAVTIFDSSQYLTNVIAGDHPNPFTWGFDLMVASVHKNFPGPQKALLATRQEDEIWRRVLGGVSTYVSNMHTTSTYAAGLTLTRRPWLVSYSKRMLDIAVTLENELWDRGVPVVRRRRDLPPTHHLWIRENSRVKAFETYERLEQCMIASNFRLLPYSLGYGIRIGTSAAARLGMTEADVPSLAEMIAEVRSRGPTNTLKKRCRAFAQALWAREHPEVE
jgi:glycine hydroxymethyltransferase